MALPAIVVFGLVAAGGYLGLKGAHEGAGMMWKHDAHMNAYKTYETYKNNLKKQGVTNLSTKDALDYLKARGYINLEDYKKALKEYEEFEKQYGDKEDWDLIYRATKSKDTFKTLNKMYKKLNEHSDVFANAAKMTIDELKGDVKEYFAQAAGKIKDVAGPAYLDTSFENESKDAEYMRLMSGQEMADLHGLDYDPNTYYDLIKQGTEANVKYTDYLSNQMNEASMIEDTKTVNSYLDAIRNNKAEALASGATAGARAAQEVLANQAAITGYADKQNEVASQRYDTVSQALIEDAQAKLKARDYFNTIAQSLATDAITLYSNDAQRYAAEQNMYASIFDANEYLRQERIKANGSMAGAYASAQAAVNAARAGLTDKETELGFIIDRLANMYNNDTLKVSNELEKIIRKDTLGYSSYVDNYNTYYNQ
jgi:hypothetical protein